MKNILALLALVMISTNANADKFFDDTKELKDAGEKYAKSYESEENPLRPLVGTIVSPLGNTFTYLVEGVDIIAREGVEAAYLAAVASGQCLDTAGEKAHGGEFVGCFVTLGGDAFVVFWNTAGYSVANIADYGGKTISDLAFIWRDAFRDLQNAAKEANVPVLSPIVAGGAYVVRVVINAAGVVVKVTFSAIANGIRGATNAGAAAVNAAVDVPVQLLRLDGNQAMNSVAIAMTSTACLAIDLLVTTPLNWGADLINATDQGNRRVPTCFEQAEKDARALRNGTLVPKVPETRMMP